MRPLAVLALTIYWLHVLWSPIWAANLALTAAIFIVVDEFITIYRETKPQTRSSR